MSFFDWLKSGKGESKNVNVVKLKEESIGHGAMAAGSLTAGAESLAQMVDRKNMPAKILMVQDGIYSQQVTDYALKMAQRLDCEIIGLDVTERPLKFSGDRRQYEIQRFQERAEKSAELFANQASSLGIIYRHMTEIEDEEKVIFELSKQDAGIRYVLTKPDQAVLEANEERVQVPVFDLNCSRL